MNFQQVLKFLAKNFLAFFIGSFLGIIVSYLYLFYVWLPVNSHEIGLAIIALILPILILFGVLGLGIGGILGIIVYQIIKYIKHN